MKCPHCLQGFHDSGDFGKDIGTDKDGEWHMEVRTCPECKRIIVHLVQFTIIHAGGCRPSPMGTVRKTNIVNMDNPIRTLIRPKSISREPIPIEVPDEIVKDYREACLVLSDSAKASAALSRRCLQHLLRTKAEVKPGNLASEIQQVIDNGTLPPHLAESLDAIRNIGNFAAHPLKSTSTGEIIDVEQGEAEWNLDVLESLFQFYFVQPAQLQAKRDALNKKLSIAGKPPMK